MKKAKRIADVQVVENKEKHWAAAKHYNFLRVELEDGTEIPLLFTDKELQRAKERAEKNPEDLPEVSFFRNLFD